MRSLLRFVVSLAFSAIDESESGTSTLPRIEKERSSYKPVVATPKPVPADQIIKPIPKGAPLPVGAITRIVSSNAITLGGETIAIVETDSLAEIPNNDDVAAVELEIDNKERTPDNLSLIRGLDPYSVTRLNARGIVTFVQVASLTDKEIARIEEEDDLPGCFNRFSWRYQAQQLHLENHK